MAWQRASQQLLIVRQTFYTHDRRDEIFGAQVNDYREVNDYRKANNQ